MPRPGEFDQTYPSKLINIGILIVGEFKGSRKHHELECLTCHYRWTATPKSKIQNNKKYGTNGCPKCHELHVENNVLSPKRKKLVETIEALGFRILSEDFTGRRTFDGYRPKITVQNITCGHQFEVIPGNITARQVKCPVCNTERKRKQFQEFSRINHKKYLETASEWGKYKSLVSIFTRKSYRTHKKVINPNNLKRGIAGDADAHQLDHIVPIRYCFENNIPPEVCGHSQNLQLLSWRSNVGSRDKLKDKIPPIFHTYIDKDKTYESFISFVQKLTIPFEENTRLLDPYPITLYSPAHKIGILYCPIDEYREQQTSNKNYNKEILNRALQEGVRLIQIYDDEWFLYKDIWLNKIQYIFGMYQAADRVFARKCQICSISAKDKSQFLNNFHIQGTDNSTISIGAYNQDKLLAVMTFTNPRVALGGNSGNKDSYELSRFATDTNYQIPGIASKLLKYFENNFQWDNIYSFADRRYSEGNLYYKIGFKLDKTNPPDYYYIINGVRKHRWNYRKDIISKTLPKYNPALTEYENMKQNGYDRVWNCGTLRFIKHNIPGA